ncbi:efflux RND transporter periplasmic adaptor subunit [Halobacteriovorax sp. HLS]|uniref:efflux RND transporter periplasmic adaptor subunit n=1 Tax=Halobacteriovorax sp. HLS TaxID=2234000 RepID=UPI000FD71511|nr:efflux RND transporter periplasmic adaptor subunit [Halobacteriovorax sp. HLS]
MKRLITVLFLLLVVSCKEKKVVTQDFMYVKSEVVFNLGGDRQRTFSGIVESDLQANMSFKVSGSIEKLNVKVGSIVKKGDVLAQILQKDFVLELNQLKSSYRSEQSRYKRASEEYNRITALYSNSNASRSELDEARANVDALKASIQGYKYKIQLAERKLGYTILRAPNNGKIASRAVEVNENVSEGQTIVSMLSETDLKVVIGVPEQIISKISQGDKVIVQIDSLSDMEFEGVVFEVGVSTAGAAVYPVSVKVPNEQGLIKASMAASVKLNFALDKGKENLIVVPSHVVLKDETGTYVFLVEYGKDGFGILKKTPVEVGALLKEGIEILSGVVDGQEVLTAGVDKAKDAMKVKKFNKKK